MMQDGNVSAGRLQRSSYHHGNLTNALVEAATGLARAGGPEAVVLREAARRVGVSATAAYRHFANHSALIHEVKQQAHVALAQSMLNEIESSAPEPDPAQEALRRLHALAAGYIRFALEEPGLFRTGFVRVPPPHPDEHDMTAVPSYQMLIQALEDLVKYGLMHPSQLPYAPITAWSTTHGLAVLLLDGPLARLPEAERPAMIERMTDTVIAGLTRPVQ